jgi:hypothetical protein
MYLLLRPSLAQLQSMEVDTLYYCQREVGQTDTAQHTKYRSNIDLQRDKLYMHNMDLQRDM